MTTASVDDVARALLDTLGPMDAMKLEKLVYYVQAWHVAIYDDSAFAEPIEAWRDGPVVDHLYQQHRQMRRVASWPSGNATRLSRHASTVVQAVVGVYGELSGDELSQLTHSEGPWVAAREGLRPDQRSRKVIPPSALRDYYRGKRFVGRRPSDLAVGGFYYDKVYALTDEDLRELVSSVKAEGWPDLDLDLRDLAEPRVPVSALSCDDATVQIRRTRPER